MQKPTIAFLNVSTVVTAAELTAAVAALQIQVSRDFAPAYGIDAFLTIITVDGLVPDAWQIVISDDSDQAGALGYHELTQYGQPLGKVFAASDRHYGLNWTITASHELLEMLADPWACLCAFGADNKIRAYEVCDAVEADELAYKIDGGFGNVSVSDFVLPSWFDSSPAPYDFKNNVNGPLQLLPGGYIGMVDPAGNWTQVMVQPDQHARTVIKPGSRRDKRSIPRAEWKRSV
jgi:hypothetical protein